MRNPSFSSAIRALNKDDPKRLTTLEETEKCLARLIKRFSPKGWEADVNVDVPPILVPFLRLPKGEQSNIPANVLVEWANYSVQALVILSAFKAIDLGEALVHAANNRRFAICAVAQRGLMELAAMLNHFRVELERYSTPQEADEQTLDAIRQAVIRFAYGGQYDWIKVTSGKERIALEDRKWRRPREHWLPNWTEMIKRLDSYTLAQGFSQTEGALLMRYAQLSEFVHPTFASAILYGDSEKPGRFRLRQKESGQLAYLCDLTVIRAGVLLLVIERLLGFYLRFRFSLLPPITGA